MQRRWRPVLLAAIVPRYLAPTCLFPLRVAHLVTVPLSDQLGDSEVLKAALLAVVFTVTAVGNKLSRVARPVWRWRPAGDSESEAILGPRQAAAWPGIVEPCHQGP